MSSYCTFSHFIPRYTKTTAMLYTCPCLLFCSVSEPSWRHPGQQSPEYRQLQILPLPLALAASHAWGGQTSSQKVPQPWLPSRTQPSRKTQVSETCFDLITNSPLSGNDSNQSPLLPPSHNPCLTLALFGSRSQFNGSSVFAKSKKSPIWFVRITYLVLLLVTRQHSAPHFISCRLLWVINMTRHQSGRNLVYFFPSNKSQAIWRSSSNETAFETCSDKAIFKKVGNRN